MCMRRPPTSTRRPGGGYLRRSRASPIRWYAALRPLAAATAVAMIAVSLGTRVELTAALHVMMSQAPASRNRRRYGTSRLADIPGPNRRCLFSSPPRGWHPERMSLTTDGLALGAAVAIAFGSAVQARQAYSELDARTPARRSLLRVPLLSPIIFLFSLVRSVVDPSAAVTFVNLAVMSLFDQIPILTTAKIAMLPSAQAAVLGAGEATALTADQAEALAKGEAIQLTPEQVNAMAGERQRTRRNGRVSS
jgi:hypothetical protein